jgi:hypothetical protein
MSTFIATDCQNVYTFGLSLSHLEDKLNITINADTKEKKYCDKTKCELYTYQHPDMDTDISIFEFVGEWRSFMQCDGPDSECCFLIPKTNIEFFKEMTSYMNGCLIMAEEEGDQIDVTVQEVETHKITKYTYYYNGLPADVMTFALIELK